MNTSITTIMTMANEIFTSSGPEATEEYAAIIAGRLNGGEVIVFSGDLGSGKTTFIRGLADGLGADPRSVSSPSYTIVNVYEGNLRLVHIDLYRLGDESEITELGIDDLFDAHTVAAIEWGERLPDSIKCDIRIHIEITGDSERKISMDIKRA